MDDDFGIMDGTSSRLPNNMNEGELGVLADGNYDQSDMANLSRPNLAGFGSASLWAQSLFLESSNTCGNGQSQASRYLGHGETDSTAFNIGSDVPSAYIFGSYDSMASNTFERPIIPTNQALPLESGQVFSIFDPAHESTRLRHVGPTCSISHDVDNSTLKKRKTSVLLECREAANNGKNFSGTEVLKLLFKYNRDLTMTQMEEIAEDTACSCEYVFHSYLQYRKAAKAGRGLLDTSSTRDSGIATVEEISSSIQIDLSKSSKTEDTTASDEPSQDIRKMDDKGEKPPDTLDHTGLEKCFRCIVSDCNMSFFRQGDLNRHSKKHRPGEHPCAFPYCGKVFYRKDKLRQHWEKEHGNSPLPSNLSSSRPRKDHDQDGNSRSNGSSSSEPPGRDGKSSGQSFKGRSSHTSGSSGSNSAPGGYNGFSRSVEVDKIYTDCKNDVDRERDENTETASPSIHRSDVDSEIDVDSLSLITVADNAKNEQPGKDNESSESQTSPSNDLIPPEQTHGSREGQPKSSPRPSSTDLQDTQQSSLPDRQAASESFQSVHAAGTQSRNDQAPIQSRMDSQKTSSWINRVIPTGVLESFSSFLPSSRSIFSKRSSKKSSAPSSFRSIFSKRSSKQSSTPSSLSPTLLDGRVVGIQSWIDQTTIQSRMDSQKISSRIDCVTPLKVLYEGAGDSLRGQLHSARKECPRRPHNFFVPICALESLITVANVERDIRSRSRNIELDEVKNVAEEACRYARNVYAVLAYMEKGSQICSLLRDGVSDEDLPLTRRRDDKGEYVLQRTSGVPIKTFESWNYHEIEEFDRIQWWMITPVFEDKRHYELNDSTVLPFITFKTNAETEQKKEGGYGEVYAARVHPAHHNFWKHSESEEDEPLVAVKRLYSSNEMEFEKEVTILKALGSKQRKHPHLIRLLATFKHERKYHLMFPYADANLRKYWGNRPSPSFDEATVLWVLKQMMGIASALSMLHNFSVVHPLSVGGHDKDRVQKDAELSVQKVVELFGRHGDIKPENILWFQKFPETGDEQGILQIADFGLGRFHGRDSRSRVPPEDIQSSPTYEPPECKLYRPVSRAYDIWSLGCLYLEFITWLLKGSAAIEGFSDFRGQTGQSIEISDDRFFTITIDTPTGTDAVVREEVVTWVRQLHEHEKCSALIHDLLDLIMKDVLLVDSTKRASARWLFQQLNMYLVKANNNEDYLLKPVPRPQKPNGDLLTMSTPVALDSRGTSGGGPTIIRWLEG